MLSTTVGKHPSNWEQNIRGVCLAYNSSVHALTGFSPFFLMFGQQVKLPVDLMYGSSKIEEVPIQEYVQMIERRPTKVVSTSERQMCDQTQTTEGYIR